MYWHFYQNIIQIIINIITRINNNVVTLEYFWNIKYIYICVVWWSTLINKKATEIQQQQTHPPTFLLQHISNP